MKPNSLILAAAALAVTTAFTALPALAADRQPVPADVPPPPGLNDPGVSTPAAAKTEASETAPPALDRDDPLAPVPKPDARLVRDKASRDASATAQRVADSDVTTRKQGNDTVEEYRQKGRLWMVRIVPQNGPTQTFMADDPSGRLLRDPTEGPIAPVYYTLYEWK